MSQKYYIELPLEEPVHISIISINSSHNKIGNFFTCVNNTCKRLFKTEENAEKHFCWNTTQYSLKRTTSDNLIK